MEANRVLNTLISGTVGPVMILVTIIIMIWYAGSTPSSSQRAKENNLG